MKNLHKFDIRLEEPFQEDYFDAPEDPLGELSNLEMGLRRFCFECNRQVLIEVADEKIFVLLDPDICLLLDKLPDKVADIAFGKKNEMAFPESCFVIELKPLAHEISCVLKEFGREAKQKKFELDKNQVLETLKHFLNEVIGLAVGKGYITLEEKDEFLLPISNKAVATITV